MLLALDIGNTHTVIGVFDGARLVDSWRISTSRERTADETGALLAQLLLIRQAAYRVDAAIISSVVPGATEPLSQALERYYRVQPLVVGPDLDCGMPVLYENAAEVGADRIVNAVAAYERWRSGLIIVDFGTATTFDCVSPAGEYLGGAIAPGATISADALYRHAAKLPRVQMRRPAAVVGRRTVESIQSGLYFGYAGLVDGIVGRMKAELSFSVRVAATGGLAPLIAEACTTIEETDEFLTLHGLRIIHERAKARA